jgi:hypothetical protein
MRWQLHACTVPILDLNNRLQVFTAGVQSTASASGDQPRRLSKDTQDMDKHCSCHLQGKSVVAWRFWQSCTKHAVREEWDLMVLTYGTEKEDAIRPLQIHPEDGSCNGCRNFG